MTTGRKFLFGSLLLLMKIKNTSPGRGRNDLEGRVDSITFGLVHQLLNFSNNGSTGRVLVEFSARCFAQLDEKADYQMIESPVFFAVGDNPPLLPIRFLSCFANENPIGNNCQLYMYICL
eukprot:GHVR01045527.1.p1 GENE.GHVR01045527.1~~GHVR01045527.1.p1  ORF type:complete len:120 (+),score=7.92 GHVR01045527.1:628-987(+)